MAMEWVVGDDFMFFAEFHHIIEYVMQQESLSAAISDIRKSWTLCR